MMPREPEENPTNSPGAETNGEEDIEALKRGIAAEKEKAENYLANWQRTQADFINYKRRSEQEKEEISKFANVTLMLAFLPVIDDFERAFTAIPEKQDVLNWIEGILLIERKLQATLEAQGLSPIKAVGEPFDPHQHEAVRQDKGEEGIVIAEVQKGYRFRDRVIRPSQVVVGTGERPEN
ncbi:MAG: nucleotide exchange factor GrpE [Dehalococcoidales bacterium]|nr:nucleotide exchange factor GrpE [Dehalococcoidales bacterium]